MSRRVPVRPLERALFASFGDILDTVGEPDRLINQGLCGRFHDRARLEFADGRAGISLFDAVPRSLPLELAMMERHPDGSQAFIPMAWTSFLVVVAADENGRPGAPMAFETAPGQAINFLRGIWHGVLTPLHAPGLFAVVDRIGPGSNLEEFWFDEPFEIVW